MFDVVSDLIFLSPSPPIFAMKSGVGHLGTNLKYKTWKENLDEHSYSWKKFMIW